MRMRDAHCETPKAIAELVSGGHSNLEETNEVGAAYWKQQQPRLELQRAYRCISKAAVLRPTSNTLRVSMVSMRYMT